MLSFELERGLFKLRADGPELEVLPNADPRTGNLSPLFLAQNLSLPYPVTPLSGYKPSATSNLGIATPETAFTFLNTSDVSLLSVVCVVTLVLIRNVASLALVRSIFNVPAVPGSTKVPSGLIAFQSVLDADISQSSFIELP